MLESLFNRVAGLFSCEYCKTSYNTILKKIHKGLLLQGQYMCHNI